MRETLNTLRAQHQQILQMLDQPEKVRELIHFVEEIHHPLEESVLFPHLQSQPCLRQGGPRCSYFMGLRMDMDPLTIVKKHLNEFYSATDFKPRPYATFEWLNPQSPLSIPMEEHIVGAELAQSLLYILNEAPTLQAGPHWQNLYDDYSRLLKMHIDKEDNCLFIMCKAFV